MPKTKRDQDSNIFLIYLQFQIMLQLTWKHNHITSFSSFKTAMKASWGTSTLPIDFILFFPSAWLEIDDNSIAIKGINQN